MKGNQILIGLYKNSVEFTDKKEVTVDFQASSDVLDCYTEKNGQRAECFTVLTHPEKLTFAKGTTKWAIIPK